MASKRLFFADDLRIPVADAHQGLGLTIYFSRIAKIVSCLEGEMFVKRLLVELMKGFGIGVRACVADGGIDPLCFSYCDCRTLLPISLISRLPAKIAKRIGWEVEGGFCSVFRRRQGFDCESEIELLVKSRYPGAKRALNLF